MDVRVQNGGTQIGTPAGLNKWNDSGTTEPWEPGQEGKGIHVEQPPGVITFYVWKVRDGWPHHTQIITPLRRFNDGGMPIDQVKIGPGYEIDPQGGITAPYQSRFDQFVPEPFVLKTQPAAER